MMNKNMQDKWIKAIPPSTSHGSGMLQKKLWRLVSDYVRIRDWYEYEGKCAATGRYIGHWSAGDAGHYKSYAKCNGMAKFDENNIFLQSKRSNGFGDHEDWKTFEYEIIKRGFSPMGFAEINRDTPLKFSTSDVVNKMRDILGKIGTLPERPKYFERVMKFYDS